MSRTLFHVRHHLRPLLRRSSTLTSPTTLALAHSSWFHLPDQGMKEFELLARGSGFLVRGPTSDEIIAVVSAHVAAPHRFPAYFPHEWLQHVRDSDCRSTLEARYGENKKGSTDQPLTSGFRHANLDVAAFLLNDESRERLANIEIFTIGEDAKTGDDVSIAGFRLVGESGSGTEGLAGTIMNGAVQEVVGARGFINTGEEESEMGMCGGPIIKDNKCIGILEGLVPRSKNGDNVEDMHKRVSGCSVYVGTRELQMFLHDVETESARAAEAKS